MKTRYETSALEVAKDKLLADITDPEQLQGLTADIDNVMTGLNRGAGCAERFRTLAVNCGGVCTNDVRLCRVIEGSSLSSLTVPDVAGLDIAVGMRKETISLQPMRVE